MDDDNDGDDVRLIQPEYDLIEVHTDYDHEYYGHQGLTAARRALPRVSRLGRREWQRGEREQPRCGAIARRAFGHHLSRGRR